MSKHARIQTSKLAILNGYYKNPSEELVDLWLQTRGFMTLHNAYYWAWREGRQQRAWRDIDVIGVNERHLALAQVTTNLDDKQADIALEYFEIAKRFLSRNPNYKWLSRGRRKWLIVACINEPREGTLARFREEAKWKHMDVIPFKSILLEIENYLEAVIQGSGKDGRVDNAVLHFYRNVKKYPELLHPISG